MNGMKKICATLFCMVLSLVCLHAQDLTGTVIYVNPGHGGYDSDDRNIAIAPYASGDTLGFWESKSNLQKGAQLRDLLQAAGATVYISRTLNRTADDLALTRIVEAANSVDADFMLSIHSNAGVTNYVLQLYAGIDKTDTYTYPTATPRSDESRAISQLIATNLYSNKANVYVNSPSVVGDKTFGRTAMGWSDGYGVLRGLTVPGCISEASMHDYIPETYRLMNMEYKWLEAWNFYKSFCTYFGAGDINSGNIAGTVHDSRNLDLGSYVKVTGSKDQLLKLEGAKITLSKDGQTFQTYTTDSLNNGFYLFKMLTPGTYSAHAEADGYIAQDTLLVVKKNETTYLNFMLNKIRNTPPQVISYSPNSSLDVPVLCSSNITFDFNWDVDTESAIQAFSIQPAVEGTISFSDSQHKMTFKPKMPLDTSTVYTVRLDKSLKHPGNMTMTDDFVFQFFTKNRNRLQVIAAYPANTPNVYNVSPTFEFRFDNRINSATIRDGIKVYDANGTEIAKNSRSFKINQVAEPYGSCQFKLVQDLTAGQTYSVVLDRNVVDVDGIDVVDSVVYRFTAKNVKVTDKTVLEDFEQSSLLTFNSESSSSGATGSVSRNTSTKLFGSSAYLLSYAFPSSSDGNVVFDAIAANKPVSGSGMVGLHVYGDLSGNELYLKLKSETDTKYVKLADLNFIGWEFVEASVAGLDANKNYVFAGFSIGQKEAPLTTTGGIYIDNLLLYDGVVNSVDSQSEQDIYVRGDGSFLYVSAEQVSRMELFSMSGICVKNSSANSLNVFALPAGAYILKIHLGNNKIVSRQVILSR